MRTNKKNRASTTPSKYSWKPGLRDHTCSARYPLNAIVDCLELKGFPTTHAAPRLNDDEWAVHSIYTSSALKKENP